MYLAVMYLAARCLFLLRQQRLVVFDTPDALPSFFLAIWI